VNADMRRRLSAISKWMAPRNCSITVIQYANETDEQVAAKLDRWRAGEEVDDVTAFPTEGHEIVVVIRCFSDRR
jgi:hypothetical protein